MPMTNRPHRFWLPNVLAILTLCFLVQACQSQATQDPKKKAERQAPLVEISSPVRPQGGGQRREYVGTVESRNQVSLVPQVSGQLLEVNASVGDKVRRGQVLAVVDDPQVGAQLSQAQATVSVAQGAVQTAMANARAAQETVRSRQQSVLQADAAIAESEAEVVKARSDLQLAQTTLGRTRELKERELIADQQFDQAEANERSAVADVALAEARLRSARSRKEEAKLEVSAAQEQVSAANSQTISAQAQAESLAQAARSVAVRSDLTRLRSPIDGTVVSRNLDPGAYVSPGASSVILVLANTESLRVAFELGESDLGLVEPGQKVQVNLDALPGQIQEGVVSGLAGGLDPATRTVRVEVGLPNPDPRVRPGMLGRLVINSSGGQSLLAIPLPAVLTEGNDKYVFILGNDDKVKRQSVKIEALQGDTALVSSGLSGGDRVVTQGVNLVKEGQEVRLGVEDS